MVKTLCSTLKMLTYAASPATTIIDISFTNTLSVSDSGLQSIRLLQRKHLYGGLSKQMKYFLFAINPNSGDSISQIDDGHEQESTR